MANEYQLPVGDHKIPLSIAVEMTQRYRTNRLSILADPSNETLLPLSETFDRTAILALMNTPGAAGFRIYYGMTENLDIHAILAAVDQAGADILPPLTTTLRSDGDEEMILEEGQRCPYTCPPESLLNGA